MMKFITEEYLRDVYNEAPFDTYKLAEGQRLTPGARQYLSDKGIKMEDDVVQEKKKVTQVNDSKEGEISQKRKREKLCNRLKSIEALFFDTSRELLTLDIILAQKIISLGRKVTNIRKVVEGNSTLETIEVKECSGISKENFFDNIEDCFEITEFHIQLEKGKEILKLHLLRCALREVSLEISESYEHDESQTGNEIIKNVNSIINSISQMICITVGGERCQRKV